MKQFLRNWLGITEDMIAVAQDVNTLAKDAEKQSQQLFSIFHVLPFTAGIMFMTAKDAAQLVQPTEVAANSLPVILLGIGINARMGQSAFEVSGVLPESVRTTLVERGFKVEEHEGTEKKSTFIIWT